MMNDRIHTAAFLTGSWRLSAESNREQGQAPLDRLEEPVPYTPASFNTCPV